MGELSAHDAPGVDRRLLAAPDALEHLLSAAREFFLAARAVIDVRGDQLSGDEPNPNGSGDLQKIEIS